MTATTESANDLKGSFALNRLLIDGKMVDPGQTSPTLTHPEEFRGRYPRKIQRSAAPGPAASDAESTPALHESAEAPELFVRLAREYDEQR